MTTLQQMERIVKQLRANRVEYDEIASLVFAQRVSQDKGLKLLKSKDKQESKLQAKFIALHKGL